MALTVVVWGAALVNPAPVSVTGVELTSETPLGAQLGGTDNAPIEGPRPMLASNGAPPMAAGAAGAGALAGVADVSPPVKLGIPAAPGTGANCPSPKVMKSEAAAPVF
jgi:hypothetical protein